MTTRPLPPLLRAATAAVALCLAAPLTAAAQSSPAPRTESPKPAEVSDADLRSFAKATVKVKRIGDSWEPRIRSAPDAETSQALRQQASAEMAKAVSDQGLSVDRYQEIYTLAQLDPQLRERVLSYIDEAQ